MFAQFFKIEKSDNGFDLNVASTNDKLIHSHFFDIKSIKAWDRSRLRSGWADQRGDKLQIFSKSISGIRRNPAGEIRKSGVRWKMWHPAPSQQMGDLIPPAEGSSPEIVRRKSSCNNSANIFHNLNKYILKFGQIHLQFADGRLYVPRSGLKLKPPRNREKKK